MNIDPIKFLPTPLKKTRWADLLKVVFDLMNDIKVDKIDIIKTQYELENMSDDELKAMARVFGHVIVSLDGYTSSTFYLRKQLLTIIPRILYRNTLQAYKLLFLIYNLTGIVYPTYLSDINGKLEVIEDWYESDETSVTYETLDQGAEYVLFSIPYSIDSPEFQLDTGFIIDSKIKFIRTDKEVILPTTTLDEPTIFPHLDMIAPLDLLTRHILVQYNFNRLETEKEFLSQNSMLAFYEDLLRTKKATEVLYIEPNIKIDTTKDGNPTVKTYYNYDNTISGDVNSILIGTDFSDIGKIKFGLGRHTGIDNTITDVQFPNYTIEKEDFQDKSTNEFELVGRRYIDEKSKFVDCTELAVFNNLGECIYYANFPKIIVLTNKVYSNIHLEIKLID